MAILESGETYVESIYILSLESDIVRGKDISEYMGVTRPSVSRAINSLKERGLVKSGSGGSIKLTEGGLILAKHVHERHMLIARHLMDIGVDEQTAVTDAGHIERFISDSTYDAIKRYLIRKGA